METIQSDGDNDYKLVLQDYRKQNDKITLSPCLEIKNIIDTRRQYNDNPIEF